MRALIPESAREGGGGGSTKAPEFELQTVVAQGPQLLMVLVVANGNDRHLGALDGLNEVSYTATVAP